MTKKLVALLMALMMLCSCALAEENAKIDNLTLATVSGEEILLSEVEQVAYMFYYYGYTETYPDIDSALYYLVQEAVIEKHLRDAGYMEFSAEEMTAFENEADAEWQTYIDQYVQAYLTEDTEEARATLAKQAEEYYAANGATRDELLHELLVVEARTQLENDLSGGYVPTEEEISNMFMEYGVQYQQQYENNVGLYEYYTQYQGYESWYVPEGYRSVLHILLNVDEAILAAYTDAQATYDEAASAETPDESAVAAAKTAMDEAFDAVIASCQTELDDIYARLEKGEDIKALIAEYGQDPGMQDPATLEEGYHVHAQSILYDPAFTAGAYQERMQQVGDWSDPVVGSYGIHVIYYYKDIPGGLIMTDDIRAEIEEYLISDKLNAAYEAGYETWLANAEVVKNEENIAAAKTYYEEQASAEDAAAEQPAAE